MPKLSVLGQLAFLTASEGIGSETDPVTCCSLRPCRTLKTTTTPVTKAMMKKSVMSLIQSPNFRLTLRIPVLCR